MSAGETVDQRTAEWREIQRLLEVVAPGRRLPVALVGEMPESTPTPKRPSLTLIRGGLDEKALR